MMNTHVRPTRDLRNKFAEIKDILNNHDQVIITNNGRGEAVLISMEDYAQYEEYLHRRYVLEKLDEAGRLEANPQTEFIRSEDFWGLHGADV
jgi:prevent-host-death family protein